jgi:hypothetical protein
MNHFAAVNPDPVDSSPSSAPDPCGQIGKVNSLKRSSSVSSNLTGGTNLKRRNIMPEVKYLDCSSMGSYMVSCEVLEKIDDDHYRIRYTDIVTDKVEEEVVARDRLEFPRFNEYMFC